MILVSVLQEDADDAKTSSKKGGSRKGAAGGGGGDGEKVRHGGCEHSALSIFEMFFEEPCFEVRARYLFFLFSSPLGH